MLIRHTAICEPDTHSCHASGHLLYKGINDLKEMFGPFCEHRISHRAIENAEARAEASVRIVSSRVSPLSIDRALRMAS